MVSLAVRKSFRLQKFNGYNKIWFNGDLYGAKKIQVFILAFVSPFNNKRRHKCKDKNLNLFCSIQVTVKPNLVITIAITKNMIVNQIQPVILVSIIACGL